MAIFKSAYLFLCFVILFGCRSRNTETNQEKLQTGIRGNLTETFSVSGAYALYPLVKKWADDFTKINPGVRIEVIKTGTGQGINDLLAGKNHLAMISRPLNDEEISAGLWSVPVAKDGVASIVNHNNPFLEKILDEGLSPDEFIKVFTSEKQLTWGELLDTTGMDQIVVFIRADESGASDIFSDFLFTSSSNLRGIKVTGDNEMIRSVQENKLAIGFCNFSYAFDTTGERMRDIQIVPTDLDFDNIIDRNETPFDNLERAHRSLWLGLYPKVLCRELTIGSLGKPTNEAVIEFLKYILTEGQNDIKGSGLCELNDVYIRNSLDKLR